MKLFVVPNRKFPGGRVMGFEPSTLAEITGDEGENYTLSLSFTLSLRTPGVNLGEISHVEVTVVPQENPTVGGGTPTPTLPLIPVSTPPRPRILTPYGNPPTRTTYPPSITSRLREGVSMVEGLKRVEVPISHRILPLSTYNTGENTYSLVDLVENTTRGGSSTGSGVSGLDPTHVLPRINREGVEPSGTLTEDFLRNLTDRTSLDNPGKVYLSGGGIPLYWDTLRYLLEEVPPHPREEEMRMYSPVRGIKNLDYIPITTTLPIGKVWGDKTLTLRFKLIRMGNGEVVESENLPLPLPSLVESYLSSYSPPTLSLSYRDKSTYTLSITDREYPGIFTGWNIYEKRVDEKGGVGKYEKIGSVKNSPPNTFTGKVRGNLSSLRVVPVNRVNREESIFTNIILGNGYPQFGNLTLVVRSNREGVFCEVYGIPRGGRWITLYSRDCSENPDSLFTQVESLPFSGDESGTSFYVKIPVGRVFEFYTSCTYLNPVTGGEESTLSNMVMFQNRRITEENPITVEISPPERSGSTISFSLTTTVNPTEGERITTFLKEQVPELYEQYLSPANNTSSPLGGEVKGVPNYANLFFHEVVRTNLNTSEREVFSLVGDGVFSDSPTSRTLSNIREPDPSHEYIYQVFSYRKNPLELFKKFVSHGKNPVTGKDWFYLPYKWRNGKSMEGTLYPDDENGIPIIDTFENFTSTSYGETGSLRITGSSLGNSLRNPTVRRVDRRTVKISWEVEENSLFESFTVMKVVNGVRSILGRVGKNYIYHDLKEKDLGTVYYIILPLMMEWDFGTPVYTEPLLLEGEGIVEKIRIPGKGV